MAGTLDGHEDDEVVVTNAKDALRLVLVPSTGADGAANPVLPWGSGEPPATLTRVYKGKPEAAALLMREDAARLERWGYIAASQHYAEGEWGCGAWVVAALLLVILLGILVVAYMIAVHPEGTLTVVYERRLPASSASAAPTGPAALAATAAVSSAPPLSVEDRLRQLNDLRDKGLITDEEYASKRAAILADL